MRTTWPGFLAGLQRSNERGQSAMEYLMTYGWAILIIAVVLGALFQLGVFSASTFAPRAPPGACQVFRPNGPNTVSLINLEGVCSGELPQYVAGVSGAVTSNILASSSNLPTGSNARTISAWVYPTGNSYGNPVVVGWQPSSACPGGEGSELGMSTANDIAFIGGNTAVATGSSVPIGTWSFIAASYAAGSTAVTLYVNGGSQSASVGVALATPSSGTVLVIGSYNNAGSCGAYFAGQISNVQIYNTSLSGSEVNALYLEGIGGAPIKLSNLAGWWPLNGNANDYSGNNNNGVPSGVTYTNQWASGYTQP